MVANKTAQGATAISSLTSILGLDVGAVRIGVAVVRNDVRIARPLTTLEHTPDVYEQIVALAKEQATGVIVVGWPRGLDGQSTQQTRTIETFVARLRQLTDLPVHLQDEALTSQKAAAVLQAQRKPYQKGEIDALAAAYILEDYIGHAEQQERHV